MSQCQSSIKINSSNIIGHSLKQISTQYSWKLGNNFYLFSWKYHWFQSVASYLRVSTTNDIQCQKKMETLKSMNYFVKVDSVKLLYFGQ